MRIPICDICGTRISEDRYQVPTSEPHSILVGPAHRFADTCPACENACITAVSAVVTGRRNAPSSVNLNDPPSARAPLPPAAPA